VQTHTEPQARQARASLVVEAVDIDDGYRPSGGMLARWHASGFAARKAAQVL
jgi:hypothetical protein